MTWSNDQIALFRKLFTGRPDVYARRMEEGGYLPQRQPQYNLTDAMIRSHLMGGVMLGSYPLYPNGECQWVAADFDGHHGCAFLDAKLVFDTLRKYGIEALCNTSQSGRGVHVRIIFDQMYDADLARFLMNSFIEHVCLTPLREGGSFDRAFPTQDRLDPKDPKAIGNQIAMPLNGHAIRDRMGSMLLDSQFNLIPAGDASWDWLELYEPVTGEQMFKALHRIGRSIHEISDLSHIRDVELVGEDERFDGMRSKRDRSSRKRVKFRSDPIPRVVKKEDMLHYFMYMLNTCDFIQFAAEGNLSYDLWFALMTNMVRFDDVGGRNAFHCISSQDKSVDRDGKARYDYMKANRQYDKLLESRKTDKRGAIRCETLAKYGWKCPSLGSDGICDKFRDDEEDGPMSFATIMYYIDRNEGIVVEEGNAEDKKVEDVEICDSYDTL